MDDSIAAPMSPIDPALAVTEALVGASTAALCVLDNTGRCVAVNEAFARAVSVSRASLYGQNVPPPPASDVRPFSPGGGRAWKLVTLQRPSTDTAEDVLRAVLDSLPVILNAKDTTARYLYMNAFQARIYGLPASEVAGRTVFEVLGPECGAEVWELDRQVLESRQPMAPCETQYAGVDGVVRDWLVIKNPFLDVCGEICGVATLSIDISGRKRHEESLTRAKQEAEEASRVRTQFLATVGHELRMPLNAIIGFSEFIIDQSLGPVGHPTYLDYVKDILNAGRHLLDVISDILDMARIEAGRLTLDEDRVDIARTVGQVTRMMALPATHKCLNLSADLPVDLPILKADPRRVRQILLNLVSNAIKFTPDGGTITVSARVGIGGDLVLSVLDTGIGIPPEHIATALAPFGRVDNAITRREEGSGLGLPLTKALLESHGGRLDLRSQPNRGTEALAIFPASRLVASESA